MNSTFGSAREEASPAPVDGRVDGQVACYPFIQRPREEAAEPTLVQRQARFQRYVAGTRQRLYNFVRRTLDNSQDAEDVTQEVFVRAWTHFEAFDPQRSFEAWVFRIATNLMIDRKRRQGRRREISLEASMEASAERLEQNEAVWSGEAAQGTGDPQDCLVDNESRAELLRTLGTLPSPFKTALLLLAQEHSYEQVARTLNCPVGTVRSRVHRARIMLRRALATTACLTMTALAMTATPATAQNPPAVQNPLVVQNSPAVANYSLPQTIEAAIASSAEIQTATRNVQIDRKQADIEFARLRPGLRFDAQATKSDDKSRVSIAGSAPIVIAEDHSEVLSASVAQDLDLLGQIRAAASQAKLQTLADQFTLAAVRNQRILTAKSLYYNLLRAEHQVQVALAALATAKQQQATALKLNLGQIGQKIDVLRANTQVADSEQELLSAQNNRDIARHDFNDLVGRPLNTPVQIQDVSGVTVGVEVTAGGAAGVPAPQSASPYSAPLREIAGIDVARDIDTAQQLRPEVLNAQLLTRVAATGIKLARAGLEPEFRLAASTNYYPTTSFQYPRQAESDVTFAISFPLYDGGATRARVQAARLQTENAQTILDRRRKDVALDVRQTYLNLVTAARQIEAANTALQQAIAARQLAQARYEGQVGLYLEVTDAESALVQAENSQVNAVYDYLIARARFENALGTPSIK